MKIMSLLLGISLVFLLGACGGGGGGLTELDGIYTIDSWTENTAGCDAPGDAVANGDTHLYIENQNLFGQAFINANPCMSQEECEMELASDTLELGDGWILETGSDSAGWTGTSSFASGDAQTGCVGGLTTITLTSPGPGMVRFEKRFQSSAPFQADASGECTTEAAEAAAQGQPCERLEVTTATLIP